MTTSNGVNVSQIVAYYRARAGLTYKDLSKHTGLSVGYLSDIERGRTQPTIDTIAKIASALGVTLAELFGATEAALSKSELALIEALRRRDYPTALQLIAEVMNTADNR